MENRFGFRDFVNAVLLLAILVSVWLAMIQFNRQWDDVQRIQEQIGQQSSAQARLERILGDLQQRIESGVAVAAPQTPLNQDGSQAAAGFVPATELPDPFNGIKEARELPEYAQGDYLVDAFGAQVARITPHISSDVYGNAIIDHVLETLATRDAETLEWAPLLARSWKIVDNSQKWREYVEARMAEPLTVEEVTDEPDFPDEKPDQHEAYVQQRLKEGRRVRDIANEPGAPPAIEITFELRRGVTFSDGEPLTAQDLQYGFDLIMNPEIDAPRLRNIISDKLASVTATGPYEVVFRFKEPYFEAFDLAAGFQAIPKHFYSQFSPEDINERPGLLLGSGPYRMASPTGWVPGEPLVLLRNERYWGEAPAFERLVYREINNDVARLTAFRNGEVDLFSAMPEQYVKMVAEPDLLERTQHFEYERPTGGYGYIAWNQRRGDKPTRFSDVRVRQAMTMLTPRQRMIDDILRGYGFIVTGPFNRLSNQYNHEIAPWPYDPSQARALLSEAGYEDRNGDGVVEGPDGKPFVFRMTFPSGSGFWDPVMLLFKDSYAKAGIIMELDPLEWSVFGERLKGRDFDAIALAWGAGIETDIYQMFHSANIGLGADNFMSYRNPELDQVIETARSTIDEEARMPLWKKAHAILHHDQPYTFLYSRKALIFTDDRIHNIQRVRIGLNSRYEWFVPANLQQY